MGRSDLQIDIQRAKRGRNDLTRPQLLHRQQVRPANQMPQTPSMDPEIYRAATSGDTSGFHRALQDGGLSLSDQITPFKNTALHLAASSGHTHLVETILQYEPEIFKVKNILDELAIHVAASSGHLQTLKTLATTALPSTSNIDLKGQEVYDVLRQTNYRGNTALHLALIGHHEKVAEYLVTEEPRVIHCLNDDGKSPLYLAIEAQYLELVELMMENSADLVTEDTNKILKGESFVQSAIRSKNTAILDAVLSKYSILVDTKDEKGTTPLSFAASISYLEGVCYLLDKSSRAVYQSEETGSNPIHVASRRGHVNIIEELLRRYPDSKEMVNTDGQSILHVAAKSGRANVVQYMLKRSEFEKLINGRDCEGNTPLHLAAAHFHPHIISQLIWDNRVHLDFENYNSFTALDVAEEYMGTSPSFRERLTWIALKSAGAPRARRYNKVKTGTSKQQEPPDMNKYKDRVNTLLLVSTLVATVTFAAGFTLPGGYTSSDQHTGTAILVNKHMFHAYLIFDTIALYSSIIVAVALIWAQLGDLALVLTALKLAMPLLGVALTAMSIAFMAGVYLAVRNVMWLASFILIMGLIFLVILSILFIPFCSPNSSNYRIARYILYVPFYLMMLAIISSVDEDEEE